MSDSYEADFYGWAEKQAALLRAGRLAEADIAHIAEEIESMGRSEKRELVSRLRVLLLHLLKWRYQPTHRGASWRNSVETQREDILDLLDDNPSLTPTLEDCVTRAYRGARRDASTQTGLDVSTFPADCPWTYGEAIGGPLDD